MPKNTVLLLIIWNVLLSALIAWGLLRTPSTTTTAVAVDDIPAEIEQVLPTSVVPRDPGALTDAKIAFFYMDSVQKKYEMISDRDKSFRSKGQQLENNLKNEMAKAQARYEELMQKDHTYSTQAEVAKDEQELQGLMARIQGQQANSEQQLARLEAEILTEITKELKDYLESYNTKAGFDYIFSVQNGGQVWVGNKGLDISDDIINGLNERYLAAKGKKK